MIREESSRRRRSAAEPEPEPRWRRSAEEEESETPALSAAILGKRNYQALLDLKLRVNKMWGGVSAGARKRQAADLELNQEPEHFHQQEEALDTLASLVTVERRKRSTHSLEGAGEGKLPKKTPSFLAPLAIQNYHSD